MDGLSWQFRLFVVRQTEARRYQRAGLLPCILGFAGEERNWSLWKTPVLTSVVYLVR